jgi:ankyrin repeat protein
VMGSCETLNPDGLNFLAELNAPFTDHQGNRMAPVGLVLETYCRHPRRKHEMFRIFERKGYEFPDTLMMAFHRGDLERLKEHLRREPDLIKKRWSTREIYPAELGCGPDGKSGMTGTPLDGTTLLHMAIDFDEQEIFDLLLSEGADVNARASVDPDGFGGHTPLFNAVVSCATTCGRQRDGLMGWRLIERGADPQLRANVRKFLDWVETPRWHKALDVTAAEWAREFPERGWVNTEVLKLLP